MILNKKYIQHIAVIMATLMLCGVVLINLSFITAQASVVRMADNIWSGEPKMLYQKYRKYLYRMKVYDSAVGKDVDIFCIYQFGDMFNGHTVDGKTYNINDPLPDCIFNRGDFERFALIFDWYGEGVSSNVRYAAAQVSIWGIINRSWNLNDPDIIAASNCLGGRKFLDAFEEVKTYVDSRYSGGTASKTIPDWCSMTKETAPPQNMILSNGIYRLELDISKYPDFANVNWILPIGQSGWKKFVEGNNLVFTYSGMENPTGIIQAEAPYSIATKSANSSTLTIYIPDLAKDQPMARGAVAQNILHINIGGSAPPLSSGEGGAVEIYRHSETFQSNYNIELEKYCAETGQELQGSVFEVLEAFNGSQLGDGTDGSVAEEYMSPAPAKWAGYRICGEIKTDSSGQAFHNDYREYEYSKTYCGGHPEPDYVECDHDSEEGCGCEEENERRKAEWEALCELCEAETDFHSEDDGEAEQLMLSDRDLTYETFIGLEYDYTVREKSARSGYILHGKHNDDETIEHISTTASEAGGNVEFHKNTRIQTDTAIENRIFRQLPGTIQSWKPQELFIEAPPANPTGNIEEVREITGLEEQKKTEPETRQKDTFSAASSSIATRTDADKEKKPEEAVPERASSSNASSSDAVENIAAVSDGKTPHLSADLTGLNEAVISAATSSDAIGGNEIADNVASPSFTFKAENDDDEEDDEPLEEMLFNDLWGAKYYSYLLYDRTAQSAEARLSSEESEGDGNDTIRMYRKPDDEEAHISMTLPSPQDDDIPSIGAGNSDHISHVFKVNDHRTEGELHINKRDLELYQKNPDASYGKSQGNAVLSGAVYGLYAAEDIVHPDGKTGTVFLRNDLVSIATTDQNGDASFLVITEESAASANADNLSHTWIGHPLILGNYYIKEIARSEGYELSVNGLNRPETNRKSPGASGMTDAGTVLTGGLYNETDNFDGTWNEFQVTYNNTSYGYDIMVTGYPKDSEFFRVDKEPVQVTEEAVIGRSYEEKIDENGNIIYKIAEGGENKLDASGNYIVVPDSVSANPIYHTYYTNYRLKRYPAGTAVPTNPSKWNDSSGVDVVYAAEEAAKMLEQLGYSRLDSTDGDGAPWLEIPLSGDTNQTLITSILDWFAVNDFWDCASVHSVYQSEGQWKALIFHDYKGITAPSIYDSKNGCLYIRKTIETIGGADDSHAFIKYDSGEFVINGSIARVPEITVEGPVLFGDDLEKYRKPVYEPVYETYLSGEFLLDSSGNKIPEMEWVYQYGEVTEVYFQNKYTAVPAVYQEDNGEFLIHIENEIDWNQDGGDKLSLFRAVTKEKSIETDNVIKAFADYLIEDKGAAVSVCAVNPTLDAGSYIKFQTLSYPGQLKVYQDAQTRIKPVLVMQRVIKQSIKVTKDIAQDSYDDVNTYKIHRDPFTVLFGGYAGTLGTKALRGFQFRVYFKEDLVRTGLLKQKEDGSFDYQSFFDENPELAQKTALFWDKPEMDSDGDLTTLCADQGSGVDDYWGSSVPLPYGDYVIEELQPFVMPNKHYQRDYPQEITLPFVPQVDTDGTIHETVPAVEFFYDYTLTPQQLNDRYQIRFNEESHEIKAHNHDGDFLVFKYGLEPDLKRGCQNPIVESYYHYNSISEDAKTVDQVYYETYYDRNGAAVDYGITLDHVPAMQGKTNAVDRVYAPALVPWSVLEPVWKGGAGDRRPDTEPDGSFNFVAHANADFENIFYGSKIRIEKLDHETGENIIHEGAIFKIYAAKREITGTGGNGVTGSGNVIFDKDGIPVYDEKEQIFMKDQEGNEVGLFKAFSTEREVMIDGAVKKQIVGYIETYQPLGAGVYVLKEVQAPAGYVESKPIAFEVYSDKVTYYEEGDASRQIVAKKYQYAVPVGADNKFESIDVSQIVVRDYPSHGSFQKVEKGQQTLTYEVRGTKQYLEARGDVKDISFDSKAGEYVGTVTRQYDEWSENLVEGTEEELKKRDDVKLIYLEDGTFTGKGIQYKIYVKNAQVALYSGLEVEKIGKHSYKGVKVEYENGKIKQITASETGTHQEITTTEKETGPPHLNIWDTEGIKNKPLSLLFYDLEKIPYEIDEKSGELFILDIRGNRICMADSQTGMAYVYDDYKNIIVYPVDAEGNKQPVMSIAVQTDESGNKIYTDINIVKDENDLPVYYKNWKLEWKEEDWITAEHEEHKIARLPFGAYIWEEIKVPFEQGYVQTQHMGLILKAEEEEQDFWLKDDFTKINLSKVDIATKSEITDAEMTLYCARKIKDTLAPGGYRLEKIMDGKGKPVIWSKWISGYLYNDNGDPRLDEKGHMIKTTGSHWIDHIPVGPYILEETKVPHDQGYVQSGAIGILVEETGEVQTFVMEDDYTQAEIIKQDMVSGKAVKGARLGLYHAVPGKDNTPLKGPDGKLLCGDLVFEWVSGEGKEGEPTRIEVTKNASYYLTSQGSIHIDYLPIGNYVLAEIKTPDGYATSDPVLISINEIGGRIRVQSFVMQDVPLQAGIQKTDPDGNPVCGAVLALYKKDSGQLIRRWTSKKEAEKFPYIHKGTYTLVEEKAPYGYQKSHPVDFTIVDSQKIQYIKMENPIPSGTAIIVKSGENGGELLAGAKYKVRNETTNTDIQYIVTDENGTARSQPLCIGYTDQEGIWKPYLYSVVEIQAPPGYELKQALWKFQFVYGDIILERRFTMTNRKSSPPPSGGGDGNHKEPPLPAPPRIIEIPRELIVGKITAFYPDGFALVWQKVKSGEIWGLPWTGSRDSREQVLLFSVGICILLLNIFTAQGGKRRLSKWLKALLVLWVFLMVLWYTGIEASAGPSEQLTLSSDVLDSMEEYYPQPVYMDPQGTRYVLDHWEFVPAVVEERVRLVESEILYQDVEMIQKIPGISRVTGVDESTGQQAGGEIELVKKEYENIRWSEDFQFLVTFHTYHADYYELGEDRIPYNKDRPQLDGCEAKILSLIGVSPADYEIREIAWQGEVYQGEDGQLCRDALAKGRKKIADCRAYYQGNLVFPALKGRRCVASYVLPAAETGIKNPVFWEEEETEKEVISVWEILKRFGVLTIASLVFVLILLLIVWLFFGRKKRGEKKTMTDN